MDENKFHVELSHDEWLETILALHNRIEELRERLKGGMRPSYVEATEKDLQAAESALRILRNVK